MASNVRIEKVDGDFEIGIKRFYAPFVVRAACPSCGREVTQDLTSDYLSYPTTGAFDLEMYCYDESGDETDCDSFVVPLVLGLTLEEGE